MRESLFWTPVHNWSPTGGVTSWVDGCCLYIVVAGIWWGNVLTCDKKNMSFCSCFLETVCNVQTIILLWLNNVLVVCLPTTEYIIFLCLCSRAESETAIDHKIEQAMVGLTGHCVFLYYYYLCLFAMYDTPHLLKTLSASFFVSPFVCVSPVQVHQHACSRLTSILIS